MRRTDAFHHKTAAAAITNNSQHVEQLVRPLAIVSPKHAQDNVFAAAFANRVLSVWTIAPIVRVFLTTTVRNELFERLKNIIHFEGFGFHE